MNTKRRSFRFLLLPLSLALLACSSGCTSTDTTQTQQVSGRSLALTKRGSNKPTVVLQSGLGDGKGSWAPVIEAISMTHEVVAYDRPGYGGSPNTDRPRDPCSVAREMRDMLRAASIQPPYILVGHSLGGLYQYTYAKLFPEEVAGLLLLDPTHPEHWARMQKDAPSAAAVIKGVRLTLFNRASRAEFDQQEVGLKDLALRAPLRIPVRHLVRTKFQGLESGGFERLVHELEKDWSTLLGTQRIIRAEGSGHYIHKDRPELVLQELRSLAAEIKESQ